MPNREGVASFWSALGALGNRAQPGLCICRHARQDALQTYGDDVGSLATILKRCVASIPETHPLRGARFWSYERPPTLEATRQSWEAQVRAVSERPDCNTPDAWKKLFAAWKAVGFHPILEGVGHRLILLAREGYLRRVLPVPEKTIPATQWLGFVQWLWDYKGTYDSKDFKKHLSDLGCKRVTAQRIEKAKEWKEQVHKAKNGFGNLLDEGFSVSLFPAYSPAETDRMLERLPFQSLSSRLVGLLPNNVSAGELSLEAGAPPVIQFPEERHVSPSELVMSIQTPVVDDPRKELLISILQIMGQAGRRTVRVTGRNEWCDIPTDREWLFGLASSLWLLGPGATLEGWARTILIQIINWLDDGPKGEKSPAKHFKEYSKTIGMILNLKQVREQMQ